MKHLERLSILNKEIGYEDWTFDKIFCDDSSEIYCIHRYIKDTDNIIEFWHRFNDDYYVINSFTKRWEDGNYYFFKEYRFNEPFVGWMYKRNKIDTSVADSFYFGKYYYLFYHYRPFFTSEQIEKFLSMKDSLRLIEGNDIELNDLMELLSD